MNTKYLWNYDFPLTYYSDIENVLKFIKDNKLKEDAIIIADGYEHGQQNPNSPYFFSLLEEQANENSFDILYTDNDHLAFSYNGENDAICLNSKFYDKYKNQIISLIKENYLIFDNLSSLYINKDLYDEEFIKNLLKSNKIYTINFKDDVIISEDMLMYLKENHVKTYHGNRLILDSNIFGFSLETLANAANIRIDANYTDYRDLTYIGDNTDIKIEFKDNKNVADSALLNIVNIIDYLRKNDKNNKVIIDVKNRFNLEKDIFLSKCFRNVFINWKTELYTFEEFKNETQILDLMVKDIKKSEMTEFEKYLAVYDIVKKFKGYKEHKYSEEETNLRLILNNDYIACGGFSELLIDLLSRVGISATDYTVLVDTSYDDGYKVEEKPVSFLGHARVIVKLNDDKYDIHGFYVADPTWDNVLNKDYYNHAIMTFDETSNESKLFKLTDQELFMNVKNIEEFSNNVNFLLNRLLNKTSLISQDYNNREKIARKILIKECYEVIEAIDEDFYIYLTSKYKNIELNSMDSNFNAFLTEIGYYFSKNLGIKVPLSVVIKGAINVNKQFVAMNKKDFGNFAANLLIDNLDRKSLMFPYEEQNKPVFKNKK